MSESGTLGASGAAGAGMSAWRREGRGHRVRRRLAAVLLALAAVLYNDWLLQFWVRTGLDQRDSYVSEAFAADQPHRVLFSVVELATAALLVAAVGLVMAELSWGWAAAGWGALGVFGACSAADVALPMRCAPSLETDCPVDSVAHTVTSGLVHLAVFVSMAAFVLAARSGSPGVRGAGRWALRLLPVSVVAAVLSAGPYIGRPGGQGLAQRVHLITVGLWFGLLAATLLRQRTQATAPQPTEDGRSCPASPSDTADGGRGHDGSEPGHRSLG
ncbi:DUF998 domain-containing protein [Streptomyces sp. NPDC006711]|uniref:DUF998 domain-containing protein n=1 Tax=unclassified Streptomyces TaxID=2593676 RepID=UPI0036AAD146